MVRFWCAVKYECTWVYEGPNRCLNEHSVTDDSESSVDAHRDEVVISTQ